MANFRYINFQHNRGTVHFLSGRGKLVGFEGGMRKNMEKNIGSKRGVGGGGGAI